MCAANAGHTHSELAVQEKYLPMMRESVENRKAFAGNLALLEDRVDVSHGKKQIYGRFEDRRLLWLQASKLARVLR